MRRITLLILLFGVWQLWSLNPIYHNIEEIGAELDSLQQLHSDIMMVRELGVTATDGQPIYAVKISDNVQVDEDEPALLFLGQCHAEEVLGVEISMHQINELLENRYDTPYSIWINYLEIWIVPTHNPEGLQVVTDEWDTSFRKNKRDNNENGIFDFILGPGSDIDGVDLNRNYAFNWVHSDTLYCPEGEELYDYYRGPEPFSEVEAQYVKQLADEQHFIYSIAWHSSRTGNLSEQVIYPWNWSEDKPCADFDFNTEMAITISQLIPTENSTGSGYYEPSATIGRNSKAHDWFYNQYGTLQFEIEAGTRNLQPEPDLMWDTIYRNMNACYYLMNRALGYNEDASMLTGHVTDAVTGDPLVAEYIIEERHAPSFVPRFSDDLYGRFWWQCPTGNYTIRVRQKGYEDYVASVTVNNSMVTEHNLSLQPLAEATLSGTLNAINSDVRIIAHHEMGNEEFIFSAGAAEYEFDWWEGEINITVIADGYCPEYITMELAAGDNICDITLQEENIVFIEDWSSDFSDWTVAGDWFISTDEETGISFAKDNPDDFYADESEAILATSHYYNLGSGSELSLIVNHKYHTEHGEDFCLVEISTNGGASWDALAEVSGVEDWHNDYYDLSGYEDTIAWLRFRLVTDQSCVDPGWWLGEIKLVSATAVSEDDNEITAVTRMQQSYPNPFYLSGARAANSTIDFALAESGNVELCVYNIKGQKVATIANDYFESGDHSLTWNGQTNSGAAASGVYFYVLQTEKVNLHQKMLIIK